MNKHWLSFVLIALIFIGCAASSTDEAIEEARFFLDNGEFAAAIEKLNPIVEDEPNNAEAVFLLGSAYVGQAAQSPRPVCDDDETGVLGILSCFLKDSDSGTTTGLFGTFARIAPPTVEDVDGLLRGIDLLNSIDNIDDDNTFTQRDVFAQIALGRMFSLSSLVTVANANDNNGDDCDVTLIEEEDSDQFITDLEEIQSDVNNAGFKSDFRLLTRAAEIAQDLEDSGIADTNEAVRTLFRDTFEGCTCEPPVCNAPDDIFDNL
jgi:hypothetical protein